MALDDAENLGDFMARQAVVSRENDRLQPELCLHVSARHMNVWGFARFTRVKVEAIRTLAKNRWHQARSGGQRAAGGSRRPEVRDQRSDDGKRNGGTVSPTVRSVAIPRRKAAGVADRARRGGTRREVLPGAAPQVNGCIQFHVRAKPFSMSHSGRQPVARCNLS